MKKHIYFLLIVLASVGPLIANAQGGSPTDPPTDPVDTPIDGGLSILLAAGIGYGVKKSYDKRKKAKDVEDVSNK